MTEAAALTAACACGAVEVRAIGRPIVSAVCYCGDCQKGGAEIEALPNAGPVRDADGGTAYTLFRKDRFACIKGAELLRRYKLTEASATNRVVAGCCNTAMFLDFDRGPHWVSAYRARFQGEAPPLEHRICTRSKPAGVTLLDDLPNHQGYPPGLVFKLLGSRLAMLFGR